MGKIKGFLEIQRKKQPARPVAERIRDWKEVYLPYAVADLEAQGARCMDCGIPFCHEGCPLGNLIPDWNDLVYRDQWQTAIDRLHATNNFPEWTGRLCPAPCEGSCVLAIDDDAVTIKSIELAIIERAFDERRVTAMPPRVRTGKPRGRHRVGTCRAGPPPTSSTARATRSRSSSAPTGSAGCCATASPSSRWRSGFLTRRLSIMEEEGVVFRAGVDVGADVPATELRRDHEAMVLAGGAGWPRDLKIPGRELGGIHFAMDYLTLQNKRCEGDEIPADQFITAHGKRVVIIGGGDTGADCLGTVHRQGARSVHQFELLPQPPDQRAPDNPWPQWPNILRTSGAHAEGGERLFAVSTERFTGNARGQVAQLHAVKVELVREGGRLDFQADPRHPNSRWTSIWSSWAMGFLGPERNGMLTELDVKLTDRGNVWRDEKWMTSAPGVFTAGDMQRGQSLIVWAIAEGRSAARGVDVYLMGKVTASGAPLVGLWTGGRHTRCSHQEQTLHRALELLERHG